MSYYITVPTAELAYYNDYTEEAKNIFHLNMSGKTYAELTPELKEQYVKFSTDIKRYIYTEDKQEQDELWHSYDKFTQYLCDISKYMKVYNTHIYNG